MTSAGTTHRTATAHIAAHAAAHPATAVLYVCAERSLYTPALAAVRAEEEGRAFDAARRMTILETITDPYGIPDPFHREGWQRVRILARDAAINTVIVRWPAAIAPDRSSDLRHQTVNDLAEHAVQVLCSWAPLAPGGRQS
ncbi:hypothetical protein ACFYOV_33150 [Streptomyces sp. NPDC005931]|uniref:hypothetical protein n=1 Tax=Streptomyces sp. NPDC005931 TaxID=3364737 RepID=UPI003688B818